MMPATGGIAATTGHRQLGHRFGGRRGAAGDGPHQAAADEPFDFGFGRSAIQRHAGPLTDFAPIREAFLHAVLDFDGLSVAGAVVLVGEHSS